MHDSDTRPGFGIRSNLKQATGLQQSDWVPGLKGWVAEAELMSVRASTGLHVRQLVLQRFFWLGWWFALGMLVVVRPSTIEPGGLDLCSVPHITLPQTRVVTCAFFLCAQDLGLAAPISLVLTPGVSYAALPSYPLSFYLLRVSSCSLRLIIFAVPRVCVALCYSFGRPRSHRSHPSTCSVLS